MENILSDRPYIMAKIPGNVRTQGDLNSFKKQINKMDLETVFCSRNVQLFFLCHS